MSFRFLVAAAAVVAIPIAVNGQTSESGTSAPRANPERRVCTSNVDLGSRLGRSRTCRTKSEREAAKQEARQVVDRVQSLKIVNNN
jgi:hypothetical protein